MDVKSPPSEMIERVARAIFAVEHEGDNPDGVFSTYTPHRGSRNFYPGWKMYEESARAAIAAMREPTEAMIAFAYLGPVTSWKAMIDQAL